MNKHLFLVPFLYSLWGEAQRTRGLWVWNTDLIMDPVLTKSFFATTTSFQTIHCLFDRGISLNYWSEFMHQSAMNGKSVNALMGESEWCLPTNDLKVMTDQLLWLTNYQNQAKDSAKFKQIHVDLEPWGLGLEWITQQHILLEKYFHILSEIKQCAVALQLPVMVDLPHWSNQIITNIYSYDINSMTTLDIAVLELVDGITFMTYRNTVSGVVGLAQPLLLSLGARFPTKKVFMSIETVGHIADATEISYFGKTKTEVMIDLRKIEKQLKQYSNFGGLSVHDYRGFQFLA